MTTIELKRARTVALALAATTLAVAAAALGAAPRADAAFTTGACAGDSLIGGGASFQNGAHVNVFIPTAFPTYCGGLGAGSTPSVSYSSRGSGCGRVLMGSREVCSSGGSIDNSTGANGRNQTARFGASDEPLTTTQQGQVNLGTDAAGDEGIVRTIPVAMGSIAVIINIPSGCSVVRKPGSATDQPVGSGATGFDSGEQAKFANFGNAQVRLKLTRDQVESIYSGSSSLDTWGELVPWINDGNGTASETTDTRCQDFPIFRIRRVDSSGTTYAFKDWLNTIDASEGWLSTYNTGTYKDRLWPQNTQTVSFDYNGDGDTADAVGSGAGTCASAVGNPAISPSPTMTNNTTGVGCTESAIPLLQTEGSATPVTGNNGVIDKVANFEGAIGYAVLGDLRTRQAGVFERAASVSDDTYWAPIQRADGATPSASSTYDDPSVGGLSGLLNSGPKGSSCSSASPRNLPGGSDPTTADWSQVSAVSTTTGYGLCTLTYMLVWDDYSGPYSAQADQAAEERKARTVKDYLAAILDTSLGLGQASLGSADYAPVPTATRLIATAGAERVGWQKSAGGGGGGDNPGGGGGGDNPGGGDGGGGTPPPVVKPSNAFTAAKPRLVSKKILLTVQVPGAGNVRASAVAKVRGRTIALGSAASTRSSGGAVQLRLTPSSAAKAALRKGSLNVTISVTFTPAGGVANTKPLAITLRKGKY